MAKVVGFSEAVAAVKEGEKRQAQREASEKAKVAHIHCLKNSPSITGGAFDALQQVKGR